MNNKIEIQEARESGSLHLCDETNKSQKKKYCRKKDFIWIIWEVSNSPKIIPVIHNKLLEYNEGFRRTWRTSYYNSSEIRGIIKQPGVELSLHKGSGFLHISEWEGIHEMRWTLQPLLIFIYWARMICVEFLICSLLKFMSSLFLVVQRTWRRTDSIICFI